jgi:hypothetical protein
MSYVKNNFGFHLSICIEKLHEKNTTFRTMNLDGFLGFLDTVLQLLPLVQFIRHILI